MLSWHVEKRPGVGGRGLALTVQRSPRRAKLPIRTDTVPRGLAYRQENSKHMLKPNFFQMPSTGGSEHLALSVYEY